MQNQDKTFSSPLEIENNKKERIRAQVDLVLRCVEQENSTFISVASLAVALMVILSLNKDLISFRPLEGKLLLTIFLVLIIVSMATHLHSLSLSKIKSIKIIDQIMEKSVMDEMKISVFDKIWGHIPKLVTGVFFLCIAYIIYIIWR